MKFIKSLAGIVLALSLVACGQKVEVPPASIGKIMTSQGYQKGVIPTSKFRLDSCMNYCDKLVLLDVSDKSVTENLVLFMPEDKLNMQVGVKATLTVDPKKSENLFATLPPTQAEDSVASISWESIYKTYAQQIIVAETREYLSKYNIPHLASNLEAVSTELRKHLTKQIESQTPFKVRHVGLVNVQYPKIITDAQENAAERREQVQSEEAQLEISKVKLQRQLQEAQLQRQIDLEEAEGKAAAQRLQQNTISAAVVEMYKAETDRIKWQKWNGTFPGTVAGDNTLMLQAGK